MNVSVQADEAHAVETLWYMHTQRKNHIAQLRGMRRAGWFLTGIVGILILLSLVKFSPILAMMIALYGVIAYIFLQQERIQRNAIVQVVRAGGAQTATGSHEYTLTPEGIQHKSRYFDGLLPWSGIEKIEKTEKHLAFHYSEMQAFLLPKSAFADEAQWMRFLQLAEQYHGQATGQPIPQPTQGTWWTQGQTIHEDRIDSLSNRNQ